MVSERWEATISTRCRVLAVSDWWGATINTCSRVLTVSDWWGATINTRCRVLTVNDWWGDTINTRSRVLTVSDWWGATINTRCRVLAVSDWCRAPVTPEPNFLLLFYTLDNRSVQKMYAAKDNMETKSTFLSVSFACNTSYNTSVSNSFLLIVMLNFFFFETH